MHTDYRSPAPVALTFDDGPDPIWTPLVFDSPASVEVRATGCTLPFPYIHHAPEPTRCRVTRCTNYSSVEREDGSFVVNLDDGATLHTGTVLFATGVRPRIQLAAEAGLEVDHGVITDSSMRTSAPRIYAVGDIAQAYNESAGRHLSVEHRGDALEHGRIAGTVIAGREAAWKRIPGFWSTIGDQRLKYLAWGDGWDEQVFEDEGEAFTVWYGKAGVLVGVLSHGADEDYERGREWIESREPFSR
jgi:3-phenylpropionate/trans-cinnamate dioxygenase ferredoxin reductase component